jgi:zinc transport system substrate-binding protein
VAVLIVVGLVVVAFLPGGRKSGPRGTFRIVCTFLPNYVFAENIVGNSPGVEVKLLVSPDLGCPHDYTISTADLKLMGDADVIVANGLGLEPFLDKLRRENTKARLITISDDCDVLKAQTPHSHSHGTDTHPGEDEQKSPAEGREERPAGSRSRVGQEEHLDGDLNPHVWVSPVQAVLQVRSLARQLVAIDPARGQTYNANAEAFVARIEKLHKEMLEASKGFVNRRIVTFHDAFAYLARDLNLEVVATLTIDPLRPPSAQEMGNLIRTIKETQAAAVFYEPAYSDAAARTIARDAGVPALPLNPFNTLDGKPTAGSYEEVMEQNLKVLKQALGAKP